MQDVPLATLVFEHEPPLHESVVHGFPSSQFWQAAPPFPHAPMAVPGWQVVPLTQFVQHDPPAHLPPGQDVPLATLVCEHEPAGRHESVVQGLLSSQVSGSGSQ